MDWDIEIQDTAAPADELALRNAIHEYNFATTGYRDGRSLSCFLRDDTNALVAGIDGFTWGGYAWIDYLWVEESRRGTGIGARLLRAAEDEARHRGCRTIGLMTHEFQAPEFYPKYGYELQGAIDDAPVGYRQLLLQKSL
jgi:GNAT superfamily N-acetyltransferase